MEKEKLKDLFKKYHEGSCTEKEKALLEAWYLQFNEHDLDISPESIKAIGKASKSKLTGKCTANGCRRPKNSQSQNTFSIVI